MDVQIDLKALVSELKSLDQNGMRQKWRRTFHSSFPYQLPKNLIISVLAHKIQANILGDLSRDTQKYLAAHIRSASVGPSEVKPSHRAGTLYEREHDGVLHRVMKTDRGFQWKNVEYKSLSAIAHAITGTKWNGPRFFGIDALKGKRDVAG